MRLTLPVLLFVSVLGVAACGGADSPTTTAAEDPVVQQELDRLEEEVARGEAEIVELEDRGDEIHEQNFAILDNACATGEKNEIAQNMIKSQEINTEYLAKKGTPEEQVQLRGDIVRYLEIYARYPDCAPEAEAELERVLNDTLTE